MKTRKHRAVKAAMELVYYFLFYLLFEKLIICINSYEYYFIYGQHSYSFRQ